MKTVKYTELEAADNPHGVDVRRMHVSEHAMVSHLTLKPGQGLLLHVTPVDVVFYVLEGEGQVRVGDETLTADADTLVDSPAGIPHRWENTSDEDLRVLIIKTPSPTSPTKLL